MNLLQVCQKNGWFEFAILRQILQQCWFNASQISAGLLNALSFT